VIKVHSKKEDAHGQPVVVAIVGTLEEKSDAVCAIIEQIEKVR